MDLRKHTIHIRTLDDHFEASANSGPATATVTPTAPTKEAESSRSSHIKILKSLTKCHLELKEIRKQRIEWEKRIQGLRHSQTDRAVLCIRQHAFWEKKEQKLQRKQRQLQKLYTQSAREFGIRPTSHDDYQQPREIYSLPPSTEASLQARHAQTTDRPSTRLTVLDFGEGEDHEAKFAHLGQHVSPKDCVGVDLLATAEVPVPLSKAD